MGSAKIQRLELEANEIHYYEEVGMTMKETNIREEKKLSPVRKSIHTRVDKIMNQSNDDNEWMCEFLNVSFCI